MFKIQFAPVRNFTLLASSLLLLVFACKHQTIIPEEPIDTGVPCNPDSVYFNAQILPILASNCTQSGCHDAQSHKEGIILDNYANVRATGEINLGNPSKSELYKVLNDTDPNDRMPPAPQAALPLEQRALILKWIEQGAQNLTCDAGCDTTNVSFSASVMPIISLKCKGCHQGASPSGNLALTNFNDVKKRVDDGSLMGSINHASGFTAMPYPAGSAKLPECDIRKMQIWINNGALNN